MATTESVSKTASSINMNSFSSFERTMDWFNRHWMLVFSISYGLFVGLPFLAPVFMEIGWEVPARMIYFVYGFLCHQLSQRSFFLFGPHMMYDLPTIQAAWKNTTNPLILRQFIGNPQMGWKVAWSDRMVSMYTSVLLVGWLWYPFRNRIKGLPFWGFILLLFPMFIDGSTHFISDFAGLGQGFRYTNEWLATLTHHVFPAWFYVGDALGSFNSIMRLLTGLLFGLGVIWLAFPIIQITTKQTTHLFDLKVHQAESIEI